MATISERATAASKSNVTDLPDHDRPIVEQFRIVARKWVDADAAASLLEETKTACLAQRQIALGEMPVSRSEMLVKASDNWHEHLGKIVAARAAANMLKVHMEFLRMQERQLDRNEWHQRMEHKMGRTAT